MSRKTPKRLSAEDEALWRKVVAKATPLTKSRPKADPMPKRVVHEPEPKPAFVPRPFSVGETAQPKPSATPKPNHTPTMDRKAFNRMKRGKLKPEGRIDLHGMTLAEAHPRLVRFVHGASADGKRLVLVITGKGRTRPDDEGPIPSRPGVLRRQVPDWLSRPPLSALVLEVTPASLRHGGDGAFYVYLRRAR
ncbi:Smr/MutS family protein [Oceanicola sp. 502str15]|uniref:Smr/MutS family protein n=1 Tax=Oceanicola sp. 502str15 TaxID=2696061 RepID=UPI002095451C|nr:Smr/MutS family protein [Oceanicola sp. 502str15]MCO6384179.1 DNA mismatch repair protein MutS [Oceanicola sp. 502str15]